MTSSGMFVGKRNVMDAVWMQYCRYSLYLYSTSTGAVVPVIYLLARFITVPGTVYCTEHTEFTVQYM
jgi:hypothetical protein